MKIIDIYKKILVRLSPTYRAVIDTRTQIENVQNSLEEIAFLRSNKDNLQNIISKNYSEELFSTCRDFEVSPGNIIDLSQDEKQIKLVNSHGLSELLNAPDTKEAMKKDINPIPATVDREGYFNDAHLAYWLSGLNDYKKMMKYSKTKNVFNILDFGGASGRVARHFLIHNSDAHITVADLNINHVNFINNVFSGNIRAVKCSGLPFLPFPDNYFDLIYAFSVFTHIDCYETSWLCELARVLKNNGKAYFTIASEDTWNQLPHIHLYSQLKNSHLFNDVWKEGKEMPNERMIFPYSAGIDYSCNTLFKIDYIKRVWGKFFDVNEIIFNASSYQSAVVLTKAEY